MALCKLTNHNNREPVWVNPTLVRYVEQQSEATLVCFDDSHRILITKKAEDVAKALNEAGRRQSRASLWNADDNWSS